MARRRSAGRGHSGDRQGNEKGRSGDKQGNEKRGRNRKPDNSSQQVMMFGGAGVLGLIIIIAVVVNNEANKPKAVRQPNVQQTLYLLPDGTTTTIKPVAQEKPKEKAPPVAEKRSKTSRPVASAPKAESKDAPIPAVYRDPKAPVPSWARGNDDKPIVPVEKVDPVPTPQIAEKPKEVKPAPRNTRKFNGFDGVPDNNVEGKIRRHSILAPKMGPQDGEEFDE